MLTLQSVWVLTPQYSDKDTMTLYDSLSSPPVVGVRTGAVVLWQPSHHPSGCCTLVGVKERPPHDCKALWVYSNTQLSASFIHSTPTDTNKTTVFVDQFH